MSAIPKGIPPPISSAATSECGASTCCIPMGWDAFGLPAEQYAVQTNTHPRITTQANIDNFRRQIKSLGFSYDWDREIDTTDPQLLQMDAVDLPQDLRHLVRPRFRMDRPHGALRKGKGRPIAELPIPPGTDDPDAYRDSRRLAYRALVPVNWCPELGTVLANEEVIDGKSERGGYPVVRMPLTQWMLRITAYAERLIDDLDDVDWPRPIKDMQRNWVGRSEGAEVDFPVQTRQRRPSRSASIRPAPTRFSGPPTWCWRRASAGRPDHNREPSRERRGISKAAATKSDLDRTDLAKTKTGVFTGAHATNPRQRPVDPGLDRRLRADGLRHRRDHGRPRSRRARLRVRRRHFALPIVRVVASGVEQADAPLDRSRGRARGRC